MRFYLILHLSSDLALGIVIVSQPVEGYPDADAALAAHSIQEDLYAFTGGLLSISIVHILEEDFQDMEEYMLDLRKELGFKDA